MALQPGAANVVPSLGEMTVEFRDPQSTRLDDLEHDLLARIAEAALGPAQIEAEPLLQIAPTAMADDLRQAIAAAAVAAGEQPMAIPSGAGHDAAALAAICPVAMLFVRCKGGISHNPAESASEADVRIAIGVMNDFLKQLSESK